MDKIVSKMTKLEEKAENYTANWCWTNCGGDVLWDNNVYSHFLHGAEEGEKQIKKKILDDLNKYKSWLKELESPKLGKSNIDLDKIQEYKIRIETLQKLLE